MKKIKLQKAFKFLLKSDINKNRFKALGINTEFKKNLLMLCPAARLAGSLGVTKGEPTEPLKSLMALAEPRNKYKFKKKNK